MSRRPRRALALALGVLLAGAVGAAAEPVVTQHVLPSGLTVLVRENHAAAVVAVSLQARAGSLFETRETAGLTNLLQRSLLRGTARRSRAELVEAAEDLGGTLDASAEVESAEIRGEALARHWEPLLRLVAEVALEPALAAEEIERERRIVLGQLRARSDTPFQQALDHLLHDLYDPHPYAWPPLGRSPAVERATRADLVALHAAVYRPERLVLAVSGGVPARDVVRLAGRLFGRLPRSGAAASAPPPAAASRGSHRVVERPLQQAQVLVGYLGPALADPDYPAARVLGAVLGGGMSGRLFLELREKRGLAYSVGVISAFRTAPAFLAAYAGTAPASAEAVERGVLAEVERVRREGVTESEVARARAYLLGHLAMDRRTNARHAWHLAFFEVIGVGWRFPDRYARGLAAVGVEDVTQAARRYLDRPSVVVLRPGAARP